MDARPQNISKSVVVILVNWNGKCDTLECLSSLRSDIYPNKHVMVVDNGSRDDSVRIIRERYPEVEVLSVGQNLGFTGGNNVGISRALNEGADYIFLLNNDTTLEPEAITVLIATAEQNATAGLLTPLIHYYDQPGEAWFGGSALDINQGQAVHENGTSPPKGASAREVPWASGCAMLLPASVMMQIEGFDNRFFLNWEDVDLSLRVRKAGYKILLVPAALIYHKVGRSLANASGAGLYYYVRNRLLLLRIHADRQYAQAYVTVILNSLRLSLRVLRRRESNGWKSLRLVLRAILDDSLGRFGAARHL